MDQKDMFSFFYNLKHKYNLNEEQIHEMLHSYDIGKLDVSRIYRYLNKYFGIEIIDVESSLATKVTNDNKDNDDDYVDE
jgi:hypothetical protein